jgi:hypothetical protein
VPFWQFNEAVRGVPIRRRRDRDQRWSLQMLDPLFLYILTSCMVILALGVAAGDFS